MGCICSKASATTDDAKPRKGNILSKKFSKRFLAPSKKEEVVAETDPCSGAEGRARLIPSPKENRIPLPIPSRKEDKKDTEQLVAFEQPGKVSPHQRSATVDVVAKEQSLKIFTLPNAVEGEQVAAGWPSWLTSVAGEAIRGWVPRKADSFEKLHKIGQGTYSSVYKARDLETGKLVALKKVRFVNMDPESVRFMAREIHILRRLDHPNVIKLEGLITSRMSCSLYLVFEYMEHDLAGLSATPGIKFTEPQVKCYMQQLLLGLEHCHSRGVLHRDIKGSNLLLDNNGILRIGDLGLATFFSPDQTQPLTSRVVTLWYRPPELLLGATEYGVAVDMWSAGCILGELLAGKPIMPGRTEVEQMHKIFKLCGSPKDDYWKKWKLPHATMFKPQHPYRRCVAETFKDFPSSALSLIDVLLAIEPADRDTAASALKSEFFRVEPLPCDPSSLPKYPPSKEFDAKLRQEEARKQREAVMKGRGAESIAREPKHQKAMTAPDAAMELQASIQKQHHQSKAESNREKDNPLEEGSGFNPPKRSSANNLSHSGPLYHPSAFGSSWNSNKQFKEDELRPAFDSSKGSRECHRAQGGPDLSNISGLVASRNNARSDNHRESSSLHWPGQRSTTRYIPLDDVDTSEKREWSHLLDRPTSSHKKSDRTTGKESAVGYAPKKNRINYSGPLLPTGGNIEDMLKEHERQIQQAVRKARLDKTKTKKNYV